VEARSLSASPANSHHFQHYTQTLTQLSLFEMKNNKKLAKVDRNVSMNTHNVWFLLGLVGANGFRASTGRRHDNMFGLTNSF